MEKPVKPKKLIDAYTEEDFCDFSLDEFSPVDFTEIAKSIANNYANYDYITMEGSSEGMYSAHVRIYGVKRTQQINKQYQKQLAQYKADLAKYKEAKQKEAEMQERTERQQYERLKKKFES